MNALHYILIAFHTVILTPCNKYFFPFNDKLENVIGQIIAFKTSNYGIKQNMFRIHLFAIYYFSIAITFF